jgi:hypothetical protein
VIQIFGKKEKSIIAYNKKLTPFLGEHYLEEFCREEDEGKHHL